MEEPEAQLPPGGFNEAMNTWVLQMGFPVMNFHRISSSQVVVGQHRFLLDSAADASLPESNYKCV